MGILGVNSNNRNLFLFMHGKHSSIDIFTLSAKDKLCKQHKVVYSAEQKAKI